MPGAEHVDAYTAVPSVGVQAGLWDPTGLGVGHPVDQGPDDSRSLCYTGEPLAEALEISGAPEAVLYAALDSGEDANFVVKLCDVAPGGASALITSGWLRAQHRTGHAEVARVTPGERYEFRVPLWATSYGLAAGHRLRVAVSCADFPRIWPTRTNPTVHVFGGGATASAIHLPVVPAGGVPGPAMQAPDPDLNRAPWQTEFTPRWTIERNVATETATVSAGSVQASTLPSGGTFRMDHLATASVADDRPDEASLEGETVIRLDLPESGVVEVETRSRVSHDRIHLTGKVTRGAEVICEKSWNR